MRPVDEKARLEAALMVKKLVNGEVTNDAFEAAFPRSKDPVIAEVRTACWHLYSDLKEHKLIGKESVSSDERLKLRYSISFLNSRMPYEWPIISTFANILIAIGGLLTLGLLGLIVRRWWKKQGPLEIWPYFRHGDVPKRLPNL